MYGRQTGPYIYLPHRTPQVTGHSRNIEYGLLWQSPRSLKPLQSFLLSQQPPREQVRTDVEMMIVWIKNMKRENRRINSVTKDALFSTYKLTIVGLRP